MLGVVTATEGGGVVGSGAGAGSGVEGDDGASSVCCVMTGGGGGDLWRPNAKNRPPASKMRAPAPPAINRTGEGPDDAVLTVSGWPHSGQTGFPV